MMYFTGRPKIIKKKPAGWDRRRQKAQARIIIDHLQPHSTTDRRGGQPIRLPNGRIGGVLFGEILRKVVRRSKHFCRKFQAYGFSGSMLCEAAWRGATTCEVVDEESNVVWQADIERVMSEGLRWDFGYGLQIFLPLVEWRRVDPPEQQLSLFEGGVGNG